MAEKKTKERKTRSQEERVAEIDKKIAYHAQCIETLKKKKNEVLNPTKKIRVKKSISSIIAKAKESGMTNEQIAEKLGIALG